MFLRCQCLSVTCFPTSARFAKSCDSSVHIVLGCGLDDRGSRVRLPAGAGHFSLHHHVQNGSGAHPASYPLGTRGSFPGGKATGACSWPLTAVWCRGQRMSGAILLLPQYPSMAWCSVKSTGTTSPLKHVLLGMFQVAPCNFNYDPERHVWFVLKVNKIH
jgi:hypothetical protein